MPHSNFLSHPQRKIAFEEITLHEAKKIIEKSKTRKIADKAKEYGTSITIPNIIAGTLGYAMGGREGALEGMRQVSFGVLPYALGYVAFMDWKKKQPTNNINHTLKEL